jgi:hypothetical protein
MEQIERYQAAETAEEDRKERKVVRRAETLGIVTTIVLFILGVGSIVGGILLLGQFNNLGSLLLVLLGHDPAPGSFRCRPCEANVSQVSELVTAVRLRVELVE